MRTVTLLFFFLLVQELHAQSDKTIGFGYTPGVFLPHRQSLPQLLTRRANGFSMEYSVATRGDRSWHEVWLKPRIGLCGLVMDMGDTDELGWIHSIYPFMDLPLKRFSQASVDLHMGVGIAYLNKRFDREENFFNKAIGSHVNYSMVMAIRYRREFGKFVLQTGPSMTHASNATIQLPNLGVNVMGWNMTWSYQIAKEDSSHELNRENGHPIPSNFSLTMAFGLRESNSYTREKHMVQEFRPQFRKGWTEKCSYAFGMDFIHNKASYQDLDDGRQETFGLDALQVGVHMGIGLEFGMARLYFNQGVYFLQGHQELGGLYHRAGGTWQLSKRSQLDLSLKTHFAKADYLALGFGYRLGKHN